jgi:nucleoside-diphosphate-sugar epimerase
MHTEESLELALSEPTPQLIDMMRRLDGDIIILGIAGKMGFSLGRMAVRAIEQAGVQKRVIGVSRFSEQGSKEKCVSYGMETITCDLSDPAAVAQLPDAPNVIFMAGRKFGTQGNKGLTWVMNVLVPGNVAAKYHNSRIVSFSTGCVYPLINVEQIGCTEAVEPDPVGEYAQSALGRERIFGYYAENLGTPVNLFRLNYAIDLRYGVLHDIGQKVWRGEEIDLSVGYFNCIWQADANDVALRCLEACESPALALNVTGPETLSVRWAAQEFGQHFSKSPRLKGAEGSKCYLSNPAEAIQRFGYPRVGPAEMIAMTADWIRNDGSSLGKPTHFEVSDGKY